MQENNYTWSFSRLSTYEQCPHSWKLQYIDKVEQLPNSWAFLGNLLHLCIEDILNGEKTPEEASEIFWQQSENCPPFPKFLGKQKEIIRDSVTNWLYDFKMPTSEILGVEPEFNIPLGEDALKGFIDLATRKDGDIVVNDWKISTPFKPADIPKKRRQLYLYGAATEVLYGELPKRLVFTFPKTGTHLVFEWKDEDYQEALQWATTTAKKIKEEEEWLPKKEVGDFFCKNLCGVRNSCKFVNNKLT